MNRKQVDQKLEDCFGCGNDNMAIQLVLADLPMPKYTTDNRMEIGFLNSDKQETINILNNIQNFFTPLKEDFKGVVLVKNANNPLNEINKRNLKYIYQDEEDPFIDIVQNCHISLQYKYVLVTVKKGTPSYKYEDECTTIVLTKNNAEIKDTNFITIE
jgi:hypothetical protein